MQLNHAHTQHLLSGLEDLVDIQRAQITTENTDYLGNPSGSDYVLLEKANRIGFEVFSQEIRVDYFDDHTHFGVNYAVDSDESPDGYVRDALALIRRLLSETLIQHEIFRGNTRIRYEWFFMNADGSKESIGGPWLKPLFTFANPFRKKRHQQSRWRYHRDTGTFLRIEDDVVSMHSYDWDILIQIYRTDSAFSFRLEGYFYDEALGSLYWRPITPDGKSLFATEKEALRAGADAAKLYCQAHSDRWKETL